MRKIMYSIGIMAIFAIAVMMGTAGAASTATSTPDGAVAAASLSLAITPGCDNLGLVRGTTVTCSDTAIITANTDYKLEVKDARMESPSWLGIPVTYRGYLARGDFPDWNKLTYPFMCQGTDNLRFGSQVVIPGGLAPANSLSVPISYSQQVAGNEETGNYRIELTYTLAPR